MKNFYPFLVLLVFIFSSFKIEKACEYAGSNINFVKEQTEKAIAVENINKARYFAYKALNAIEKSKEQLNDCGCDYAEKSISEGLKNIKLAIKSSTLGNTKDLLSIALENIYSGIELLEDHENHRSQYSDDVLAMNTIVKKKEKKTTHILSTKEIENKVDISLEKYRTSLSKIVNTVDCVQAKAYAQNVYTTCEQELLRTDLTEGKRYYNLRTKEITAEALEQLKQKDCY